MDHKASNCEDGGRGREGGREGSTYRLANDDERPHNIKEKRGQEDEASTCHTKTQTHTDTPSLPSFPPSLLPSHPPHRLADNDERPHNVKEERAQEDGASAHAITQVAQRGGGEKLYAAFYALAHANRKGGREGGREGRKGVKNESLIESKQRHNIHPPFLSPSLPPSLPPYPK